jgi:hypothetical protein
VWFGVGVGVLAVVALGGVLVRFVLRPAPPPAPVASPDAWQPLALPPELLVPPADKLTGNNDEGERALRPAAGAAVVLAVRTNRPGAEPCAATAALVSAAMAPSNPAPTTAGVPSRPEDPDLDTGKTTVVVTASLRRKVFAELMAADAEATKAAAARFPVVLSGADAQAGQRRDLQEKQLQALRRVIREKHELTREQIAAIFADGIEDLQSGTTSAVGSY